jgi:hypothetical protein
MEQSKLRSSTKSTLTFYGKISLILHFSLLQMRSIVCSLALT